MMMNAKKNLPILLSFSLAILLFSYPVISEAATYYVSNSGSATWAQCTNINTPCAVQTAFDNAAAGDIVYFRGGTYNVPPKNFGTIYHGYYEPANSGTAGNPITFASYSGETSIFNGTAGGTGDVTSADGGAADFATIFGTFGRSYIVFDGFTLISDNGTKIARIHIGSDDSNVISSYITIKNCSINGGSTLIPTQNNRETIRIDYGDDILIQRCRLYNARSTNGYRGINGIKAYGANRVTIENSEIYNTEGAIYLKSDTDSWVVRNNWLHDNQIGIYVTPYVTSKAHNATNHKFYNNVIANSSFRSFYVFGEAGSNADNMELYNNTIYSILSGSEGIILTEGQNLRVYNNIVQGTQGSGESHQLTFGSCNYSIVESDYNQFGSYPFKVITHLWCSSQTYSSLSSWQASTEIIGGLHPDTHSLASDPLFQNGSGSMNQLNDFRLANNSPSKGTGKGGLDMGANIDSVGTGGSGGGDTPPPSDGGNTPPSSSSGGDSGGGLGGGSGCGFVKDINGKGQKAKGEGLSMILLFLLLILFKLKKKQNLLLGGVPMIMNIKKSFIILLSFSVAIFVLLLNPAISHAAPKIFYTDITSGPNTGGENNNGAYLSIFGKDFGTNINNVKVYVGNGEAARYIYLGPSLGRLDVQQLSVQLGPNTTTGSIRVVVDSLESNTDLTFTVRPGDIYYVALNGNDSTGIIGDINHPFRNVQNTFNRADFGPGDHIVIRSGTWTDTNSSYNSFFSFQDGKGGTATDPIVVMAYPGERVYIPRPSGAGIHAWNTPGSYTIAGLEIDMQGGGGTPFGYPPGAAGSFGNTMQNIRAVNNEIYGMVSTGGGSAAMEGRGKHIKYLGNRIHDNGITNGVGASSKLYHSIYFDNNDGTGTDDVELAFNAIWNQGGGRGIQIYNAGATGITNISVHHNLIHDIALDGLLFGDSTQGGMFAYDNIIYRTAVSAYQTDGSGGGCIRFNNSNLVANIYNNTLFNCAADNNIDSGGFRFDNANNISLINNIVATSGGAGYYTGSPSGKISTSTNNLWFSSGSAPSWDTNAVANDPLFTNSSAGDFHLQSTSPAINSGAASVSATVKIDFDGIARPQASSYDIGAYEYAGPAVPMLQFNSATYSVSESTATATISVTRTGSASGAISVNYATSNGTATAGSDYTAASGTLNWTDGEVTTKTFTVPIINDTLVESDETINLTLSNPTGGAILGSQSAATLTILDDDGPSTLRFENSSYSVSEGAGTATIRVLRTGSSTGAVSVNYATSNGTATAGSDYTAASGTLNWASGDTAAKSFTITIINDTVVESNETVNLTLSNPTNGAVLGGANPVVLTITDNDSAGGNGVSGGDASASGGSGCGFVKNDGKGQKAKSEALVLMILLIIMLTIVYLIKRSKAMPRLIKSLLLISFINLIFVLLFVSSVIAVETICPGGSSPDSNVVMCDDFEDGTSKDSWAFEGYPPEYGEAVRCDNNSFGFQDKCSAYSGDLLHFDGAWGYQNHYGERYLPTKASEHTELYLRMYIYFSNPYTWGNTGDKGIYFRRYDANGTETMPAVKISYSNNGIIPLGTPSFGSVACASYSVNSTCPQNQGNTIIFQPGRWYLFEFYFKLNDPGVANGIAKFWIDDASVPIKSQTLRLSYNNLMMRDSTFSPSSGYNALFLTLYDQRCDLGSACPSTISQYVKWDNIVVSKTLIGPMGGGGSDGGNTPPPSSSSSGGDSSSSGGGGCGFVRYDGKGQGAKGEGLIFAIMLIITLIGIALARRAKDLF